MTTESREPRAVRWPAVVLACACNVLAVAGIHYQDYVYYVVRMHKRGAPWIDSDFMINEALFLAPMIFVLLARKYTEIVLTYASVLSLILLGRIYLLLPRAVTGIDGPAKGMDLPTLGLALLGALSGLGMIVLWVATLASLLRGMSQ